MSPQAKQAILVAIIAWHIGWFVFGVRFTREWLRRRKEDPKYTPPYFPWDRVLITGFLLWWLYFISWFLRRRRRR
jgi:hypothetical protein